MFRVKRHGHQRRAAHRRTRCSGDVLGTKRCQIMPVLGSLRDSQLSDQGWLEARRGRVCLPVVIERFGNPLELVLIERAHLVEDRRLAPGLGFRFELTAQIRDSPLD